MPLSIKKIYLFFLICSIFLLSYSELKAKQIEALSQIKKQAKVCSPNYLFSKQEINSKNRHIYFSYKLNELLSQDKTNAQFSKALNLIPVNNCVLRGNKSFRNQDRLSVLKDQFKVRTLINTDRIVDKIASKDQKLQTSLRQEPNLDYQYFELSSTKYPSKAEKVSIEEVLSLLSEATPEKRVYLSCFFGKHRTGVIAGIYQFLLAYSLDPKGSCAKLGTDQDQIYIQMNDIANLGFFTYDMPLGMNEFYTDFAKSVCEKRSKEFIGG